LARATPRCQLGACGHHGTDVQSGRAPDLIAVPFINVSPDSPTDASVFDWIGGHFGANTTLLGMCSGTMALADTGLLAGRTATSNSGTFGRRTGAGARGCTTDR
jgi:transcriptional regulator GlxA family with amidase domain